MKPWLSHPTIWKTEAAWLSYVRSGIRKGLWNRYPPKVEFLKAMAQMKENPNERSKKRFPKVEMWQCEQCTEWFTSKDINVDHRLGHNSLRCVDDIGSFVEAMLLKCSFDDYAIMCTECHKCKSYAETHDISFEEAFAVKTAIKLVKEKKDKTFLEERGILAASSSAARRKQIEEILKNE